jgi:dihydrofolate reductase
MKESMISIIVAMDEKRGIGKNNNLLFRIPEDFKRMTEITNGHPIVMGRGTWESLPENRRPLPGRYNVVITRNQKYTINGLKEGDNFAVVKSLGDALRQAQDKQGSDEIFIFGGGQIYAQAMEKKIVDKLYLTIAEGEYGADTFFPDYSDFKKVVLEETGESEGYKYKFLELEK